MRRTGIMGGTFDPIHVGHLILGESAYEQFHLDNVLFMPSGKPPHKIGRKGASNEQRTEMVRLAIRDNPHFELSLQEMHDEGYSYTRYTLETLCAQNPDTEYYFIMGADSLINFDTWRDPQRICELCVLVVAIRDHLPAWQLREKIEEVQKKYNARIDTLSTLNMDVSSHNLREWFAQGRSCRYYLPEEVRDYIRSHHIYDETER